MSMFASASEIIPLFSTILVDSQDKSPQNMETTSIGTGPLRAVPVECEFVEG
jgi:hypothetical protein